MLTKLSTSKISPVLLIIGLIVSFSTMAQDNQTQILLLGCDHLQQVYRKDNPNTDVFTDKRQQEIAQVVNQLKKYQPDLILVERLPEDQPYLDSTYALFQQDKLKLTDLQAGRGEEYQLGFALGKQLGLNKIYGVNAPGGTSQSILSNGSQIELYKEEGIQVRTMAKAKSEQIQNGSLSFKDYITFLNQPETIQKTYHLRYIMPARVTNGTFTNPDSMVDTAFVNPKYIGAELISVFKNRDYKIYSNIVTTQMAHQSRRILLIIGQAHVGSLQSIFRDDPAYQLIKSATYLH